MIHSCRVHERSEMHRHMKMRRAMVHCASLMHPTCKLIRLT
jgi:hypothetical protein